MVPMFWLGDLSSHPHRNSAGSVLSCQYQMLLTPINLRCCVRFARVCVYSDLRFAGGVMHWHQSAEMEEQQRVFQFKTLAVYVALDTTRFKRCTSMQSFSIERPKSRVLLLWTSGEHCWLLDLDICVTGREKNLIFQSLDFVIWKSWTHTWYLSFHPYL